MHLPYECDFCVFNFATRVDRNAHLMQHFKQRCCETCDKSLLRIGDNWYELHLHTDGNCDPMEEDRNCSYKEKTIKMNETSLEHKSEKSIGESKYVVPGTIDLEFETIEDSDNSIAEVSAETTIKANNENVKELSPNEELLIPGSDDDELKMQRYRQNRCTVCFKKLKNERGLTKHMKLHHPRNTCDICNETFTNKRELEEHINSLHDGKRYKCETCGVCYVNRKWFDIHKVKHSTTTVQEQVSCDICQKKFRHRFFLNKHMNIHHYPDKNRCQLCKKQWMSEKRYREHKCPMNQTETTTHRCRFCEAIYPDKQSLRTHMYTHAEFLRFVCTVCGKGLMNKCQLNDHMNIHTRERPYACDFCDKKFLHAANLTQHSRLHTGEKPFKCPIDGCETFFRQTSDRGRHLFVTHRIYTKKHICPICSRVFPTSTNLKRHIRVHANNAVD